MLHFFIRLISLAAALAGLVAVLVLAAFLVVLYRPQTAVPLAQWALTPAGGEARADDVELGVDPPRVSLAGLAVRDPGHGVELSAKSLSVEIDPLAWWRGQAWLTQAKARGLKVKVRLSDEAGGEAPELTRLELLLTARQAQMEDVDLVLAGPQDTWRVSGLSLSLTPTGQGKRDFALSGLVSWQGPQGSASARLEGKGAVQAGPRLSADLSLTQGEVKIEGVPPTLTASTKLSLTPEDLELDGLKLKAGLLDLAGRAATSLDGKAASLLLTRLAWGKDVELTGQWTGGWGDGLSGPLTLTGDVRQAGVTLKGAELQAEMGGDFSQPRADKLRLALPANGVVWRGRRIPWGAAILSGRAEWDGAAATLSPLTVELTKLGRLQGEIKAGAQGTQGRLAGAKLQADKLAGFAQAMGWLPQGWKSQGAVDLDVRLVPGKPDRVEADLTLRKVGANSPTGDIMLADLAGKVTVKAGLNDPPSLEGKAKLSQGQVLWGTVYLDLTQAPLSLEAAGRLREGPGVDQARAQVELGGYGRARLSGQARQKDGHWHHQGQVELEGMDLAKVFPTFVRDPLSAGRPDLATWQVAGAVDAKLSGKGVDHKVDLSGQVALHQGSWRTGDEGMALKGVELSLPVAYALGQEGPAKPEPPAKGAWGRLQIGKAALPGLEVGTLDLPLALTPNRLWVRGGLSLPLLGGKLALSNITVQEPLSEAYRVTLAAEVKDLDLTEIKGSVPVTGHLAGSLEPVELTSQSLTTKGKLTGTVFGGQVEVTGIGAERPLSPGREIKASATARLVKLEELSQALDVGRITGLLDLDLEGLRVAYGQPVAFNLRARSVEAEDQEVSLKAVNSISVIGTGSGLTGVGVGLFASLFKEFPYAAIGLACTLRNDVFQVQGLIHEDGVEYLVKRPPFMGINVINRNPDNRISFSDMLDRLERVRQGAETETGPAID